MPKIKGLPHISLLCLPCTLCKPKCKYSYVSLLPCPSSMSNACQISRAAPRALHRNQTAFYLCVLGPTDYCCYQHDLGENRYLSGSCLFVLVLKQVMVNEERPRTCCLRLALKSENWLALSAGIKGVYHRAWVLLQVPHSPVQFNILELRIQIHFFNTRTLYIFFLSCYTYSKCPSWDIGREQGLWWEFLRLPLSLQ